MAKIQDKKASIVHIKNMVCPRCIDAVKNVFEDLGIEIREIQLGEVTTRKEISVADKMLLKTKLDAKGFELLEDQKSKLISRMKAIIIEQIHYQKEPLTINFSTFLSNKLNQEYNSLSRLFSSIEGLTVEKFILKQKIERVKELIFYKEQSLTDIAYETGFSSVAHLSTQFKKETGMTPSAFKKMQTPRHKPLDSL